MNQIKFDETFQNLNSDKKQDVLEARTVGILIQCPEWLQERNIKVIKSMFTYDDNKKIIDLIKGSFIAGVFSNEEFDKQIDLEKSKGNPNFGMYVLQCKDQGYELLHYDTNVKNETVINSYFNELQKLKNKRTVIDRINKGDGSISSISNSLVNLSETFDTNNNISISGQMYAAESIQYGVSEISLIKDFLIGYNVSILAAEPKLGKTTLGLEISKSVSTGNPLFNHSVSSGEVLYMSYDQSQNQMNSRIEKANLEQCNILFDYKEKGLLNIGIKELNQYIYMTKRKHPNLKLVIIDMFKNIRKLNVNTEYSGTLMMDDMQTIKKAAQENQVHIILIHETNVRTSKNANDKLYGGQKIASETNGSLIKLIRESPHAETAVINVDGRNVGAYEIPVRFNSERMSFDLCEQTDEELDQNIIKIINHITYKKEFVGTIQELCAVCRLIEYNPTKVGKILRKTSVIQILKENGIRFEDLKKVKGNRTIKLWVDETL